MGINQFPAGSTGISTVIRSIQRGTAASSGSITISSVDTTKTIVNSFSTSSTGAIGGSATVSSSSGSTSSFSLNSQSGTAANVLNSYRYNFASGPGGVNVGGMNVNLNAQNANAQNVSLNSANLSGGTTNLVAGVNGVYLSNATTLVATGPCRYEVIEYI